MNIMFEKVNPSHPDKIADRIAGAIVDLAYAKTENPRVACEVLIGHKECNIINETSIYFTKESIQEIVTRIAGEQYKVNYKEFPQDAHLALNQSGDNFKCGDNGIFKGTPVTEEERELTNIARYLYRNFNTDGKYLLDKKKLIICQSHLCDEYAEELKFHYRHLKYNTIVNPLGYWDGGLEVDTGATNRKLGSDMGCSVTGGGLHGKDLSKADVSVNIFCWLMAQEYNTNFEISCAIGDEKLGMFSYNEIVEKARQYINNIGGFEKFAEWGLLRP